MAPDATTDLVAMHIANKQNSGSRLDRLGSATGGQFVEPNWFILD